MGRLETFFARLDFLFGFLVLIPFFSFLVRFGFFVPFFHFECLLNEAKNF